MKKDKEYWLNLRERYYEAETTDEEERELRQFVAKTQDADFQELQAVIGYTAMGRAESSASRNSLSLVSHPHSSTSRTLSSTNYPQSSTHQTHSTLRRTISIAASIILIFGLSLYMTLHSEQETPVCVAWVNGEEISDPSLVMAMMHSTMQEMNLSGDNPVKIQLGNMFECSMAAEE